MFLLSDLQADIADLNSGQVLSLPVSDEHVSWILRDAVGAWANDQAYVLPIVKGNDKYSLLYVRVDGTAAPVSILDEDQPSGSRLCPLAGWYQTRTRTCTCDSQG